MQKALVMVGVIIVVVGLGWPWLSKLPLGRLPGDISWRRGNVTVHFPLVTSIVISIVLTLLFALFRR